MRNITFCILFLFLTVPLFASKQFSFVKYQVENGLSHNTVWSVMQDSKGFMWFGTSDGLNRFDGRNFKIFRNNPLDSTSLGNNFVQSLFEDGHHNFWVGTNKGVYLFDPVTETFRFFDHKTEDGVIISSNVNDILQSNTGDIWFATLGQGIFIYNPGKNTLVQNSKYTSFVKCLTSTPDGNIYASSRQEGMICFDQTGKYLRNYTSPESNLNNNEISAIFYYRHTLWFCSGTNILNRLNLQTGEIDVYLKDKKSSKINNIRSITAYKENQLLIGADNGLYLLDIPSGSYRRIDDPANPKSLSDQSIYKIIKDREGGLWISTNLGGVNYLPRNLKPFKHYFPLHQSGSISGKAISQFCEDLQGNIWIATEDGGLNYLNTKTDQIKTYLPETVNGLSYHNIHALMLDGDRLWIGTASKGLDILNLKTGEFKNFQHKRGDITTLSDNGIYSIYKDRRGTIYIGTVWGLNKYNPYQENFTQVTEVGNMAHIYDIYEDSQGSLWFATYNIGVYRFSPKDDRWNHYTYQANQPGSICSNSVITIFEDSHKKLWFGTEGAGLCSYDAENDRFETFDPDNKILPNSVIYAIEEDAAGNFWITSNAGLTRINPYTDRIPKLFTQSDGLQSNQFNFRSSLHARNGMLYFGGINGLNAFDPRDFKDNSFIPPVVITNFQLFNKDIHIKDKNSPLQTSITECKKITLSYYQNTISLDFAALSYEAPDKNRYAYMLKGFEKDWNYSENKNKASYTNLQPGEYTFLVKGSNNDGIWSNNPTALEIQILPPFWKTGWAYAFYILLLAALGGTALHLWSMRVKNKHQELLKAYRTQKEKETYQSKINFFTNVAHEIRTPLSLIKMPLECIIKSEDGTAETKKYLTVIEKNTERLLNLINQLLDLRKTEDGEFHLQIRPHSIHTLIQNVYTRFVPSAQLKNIRMEIELPEKDFIANVDEEALTKVISNLLSNALKYTKDSIHISLQPETSGFEIKVADNGPGIAKTEKKRIFEAFYQPDHSKSGTGIGLALAKLLTEKHSGRLFLEDNPQPGAVFVIYIPFLEETVPGKNHLSEQIIETSLSSTISTTEHETEISPEETSTKILLVEDNLDLLNLTAGQLKKYWQVYTATNGKEALQLLETESIDLIVSDIMMPEMDGYTLCESIKNNPQYCHIPVVLLTAKTTTDDKIKGLDFGADAYLEKPFSVQHLQSQIKNLLESRKKLKELFSSSPLAPPATIAISNRDKEFLDKLNAEIEKNIQESDFSVDTLAEIMCMSRSNFYRKIKGIADISPNEYLKMIRLKTAAKLLLEQGCRINEVYEQVGFSSFSYFTKCFKEQFGMSPKEFINKHRQPAE